MRSIYVFLTILLSLNLSAQVEQLNFEGFQKRYLTSVQERTVFNFWATWCIPCVKELPYFEKLQKDHPEINVVLVSLDFPKQIERRLIPFIHKNIEYGEVVVLDEANANNFIDPIDPGWEGSIPATMIWDKEKMSFYEGDFNNYEELKKYVLKYLKKEVE